VIIGFHIIIFKEGNGTHHEMKRKLDRITEIKDLLLDGTISTEEFQILKKKILQNGESNEERIDPPLIYSDRVKDISNV
jgi:hypothetical protein